MILPDDDLALAILANANSLELSATLERIALWILNRSATAALCVNTP